MGGIKELVVALETLSSRENVAPAEVFKAYNHLLSTNSQEVSENVSIVLEKFHPVTRIGRILKIRLVDRCRVYSEVMKLLLSGDSLDTNQALKCHWFFAGLENPEAFVNQIVPTLSHSVRLKVINRYASYLENTEAGEALYLGLKSRYGIRDATSVLPACSESFIRDELPNLNGIILRPNLTLALHKKYPSLATEYLAYLVDTQSPHNKGKKYITEYVISEDYKPLFRKLSEADLPAFIDIYEKHGKCIPYMTLGRRTTKNLIRRHFDQILTKYDSCKDIFADKLFYKHLSYEEMKVVYTTCILPPTLTKFFEIHKWETPVQFLKDYIHPTARSAFLKQGFQSKYGRDPFSSNYVLKFADHWTEFLPTGSRIEKIKKRLTGVDNPLVQAEFLAYLPVAQSIPQMKKLIEAQSDAEVRSSIATHMIKSLRHNNHPKGIKDLFTYFNKRFRNETKQFRKRVLSELASDGKFLLQLDEDDWTSIDELLYIIQFNKEVSDVIWFITSILKTQIHCYFSRNIEIEPHLQYYLEFHTSNQDYLDECIMVMCQNTPYQRICVEWFLKKIPTIEWESSSNKLSVISGILRLVNKVNKKKEPVVLPEEIIVEMELLMEDCELYQDREFQSMLKHARFIPPLRDRLLKIAFPGYINENVLSRFLKISPVVIYDELDKVLAIAFDRNFHKYRLFYSKCRLYESYGIPQKLARICYMTLKREKGIVEDGSPLLEASSQSHAVQVLSLVLPPSEYADLVSKYTPAQASIGDYSQEVIEMFTLQKAICRSFIDVATPPTMLPLLRKFAVGDYLKITVGSLNGVCSRVPEKEVLPLLKEWTDCPISLRKHVLRLFYRVAPAEQSMEAFVEFFKKERNSSIRRVIFLEMRRTFIANPSDQTFNFMSTIINLLTNEDEVLKDLMCVQSMSSAYVSQYLELIWNRLNSHWESALPNGKTNVIECIDKDIIRSLDARFCAELMSYDLKTLPGPLSNFIYLCILYAPSWDCQVARLKQIISALTPLVQNKWNERTTEHGHVFEVRRTVSEFVKTLCRESRDCENRQGATKILNETKTALTGLSELRSSLELSYWLDAHILFLNVQNDTQTSFECALAGLYKTYIERYEGLVPHSLAATLSVVVPMVSSRTKLAHKLVQVSELPLCQILAAKIAEDSIRTDEELILFNAIIETLSSTENPDVQTAASVFFRAIESNLVI